MKDKINKSLLNTAIEMNREWIRRITGSIREECGEETARCVMKAPGSICAEQMRSLIKEKLNVKPVNARELIDAINEIRRTVFNADTFWVFKGDYAVFRLNECACEIVQAGLAVPNPAYCLCSAGVFENLFSSVHTGNVRVETVKAIGNGDAKCEFIVHFE